MPTTFKGTGTTYSGQENVQVRIGKCERCKKVGELASFDTKLYFCLFGISLIPLGEKHVVDFCVNCQHDKSYDAKVWSEMASGAIGGVMHTYKAAPTEAHALRAHQVMLEFGRVQEAAQFRQSEQQFNNSASVQAGFGEALHGLHLDQEAERYFSRAYDLDSSLPAARAGVSREYIRSGDLQSARMLLDYLEQPGSEAAHSLAPLEDLADAAQAKGNHEMALELYARILQGVPQSGKDSRFRQKVLISEKALNRRTSLLPGRNFTAATLFSNEPVWDGGMLPWKTVSIVVLFLVCAITAAAVYNEYIRTNRSVYVFSGNDEKTKVEIVGVGQVETNAKTAQKLTLKEGNYKVNIGGDQPRTVDLNVEADYFSRFFDHAVWMINVDGGALVVEEHATYSVGNNVPSDYKFHFGDEIKKVTGVHHAFEPLPEKVSLKRGRTKKLVGLYLFEGDVDNLLDTYLSSHTSQYFDVLQWQLSLDPTNEASLDRYLKAAYTSQNVLDRLDAFLAKGIKTTPLLVEWHTIYRKLKYSKERDALLTGIYDEAIKADAKDANALYLRGTVDPTDSGPWFKKAIAANAECAWPYVAMGRQKMAQADWAGARENLSLALEKEGGRSEALRALLETCIAQGEAKTLEDTFRKGLAKEPTEIAGNVYLILTLAAQNMAEKGKEAVSKYAVAVKSYGDEGKRALLTVSQAYYYAAGDFKSLYDSTHNSGDKSSDISGDVRWTETIALMEQGRAEEAGKVYPYIACPFTTYQHLALDLALRAEGKMDKAELWEKTALGQLDKSVPADVKVAELVRSTTPPDVSAVKALDIRSADKAVLCTLLGAKHPAKQSEYFTLARQLNVVARFPWHLVNRLSSGKITYSQK